MSTAITNHKLKDQRPKTKIISLRRRGEISIVNTAEKKRRDGLEDGRKSAQNNKQVGS
jgi:hypothetical protein